MGKTILDQHIYNRCMQFGFLFSISTGQGGSSPALQMEGQQLHDVFYQQWAGGATLPQKYLYSQFKSFRGAQNQWFFKSATSLWFCICLLPRCSFLRTDMRAELQRVCELRRYNPTEASWIEAHTGEEQPSRRRIHVSEGLC